MKENRKENRTPKEVSEEHHQAVGCDSIPESRGGTNRELDWTTYYDLVRNFKIPSDSFDPIYVAEIFTSVQGEGPGMGRFSFFIRVAGCNLQCSFCDSSWARPNSAESLASFTQYSIEDLASLISRQSSSFVSITGGEPFLYMNSLSTILLLARGELLKKSKLLFVEVETNGTVVPSNLFVSMVNRFNVSPKLKNSGDDTEERASKLYNTSMKYWKNLAENNRACFKFVTDGKNMLNINSFIRTHSLPRNKCWLMPIGETKDDVMYLHEYVMEVARKQELNFSSRLHILSYGNAKGK